MLFKNASILAAATLMFSATAMASALPEINQVGSILIAADPDSACRCPNNCNHHLGSGCKFCQTSQNACKTVDGKCVNGNGGLTCQAN